MVGILPFPPEATNHLILSLFDTISLRRSSKKTRSSNSSSLNSFSLLVVSTSDELRAGAATKCDLKDLPWTLAQLHNIVKAHWAASIIYMLLDFKLDAPLDELDDSDMMLGLEEAPDNIPATPSFRRISSISLELAWKNNNIFLEHYNFLQPTPPSILFNKNPNINQIIKLATQSGRKSGW